MFRVVADEAEQGRAAAVLPRQAEEIQPFDSADTAPVRWARVRQCARNRQPGVILRFAAEVRNQRGDPS